MPGEIRTILFNLIISSYLLILAGCSSTKTLIPGDDFLLSEKATLTTIDNVKIGIGIAQISGDSIIASDYYFNRSYKFSFDEVKSISVKDHHKGAYQGALWFGAASAATTYLIMKFDKKEYTGSTATAAPFINGMFGGIFGALVGATVGKNKTFIFQPQAQLKTDSVTVKQQP